jgi:hypothetical protein
MFTDCFGTPWMLSYAGSKAAKPGGIAMTERKVRTCFWFARRGDRCCAVLRHPSAGQPD